MISKKDMLILNSLKENSRKSIKEIAEETGIPRATVFDRFRRIVKDKTIKAFTVIPDYEKIGFGTMAFVLVKFTSEAHVPQVDVAKKIGNLSGVEAVHIISGEWDMLLIVRGQGLKEIGELVVDKLRMIKGVAETQTCACFKTVKE